MTSEDVQMGLTDQPDDQGCLKQPNRLQTVQTSSFLWLWLGQKWLMESSDFLLTWSLVVVTHVNLWGGCMFNRNELYSLLSKLQLSLLSSRLNVSTLGLHKKYRKVFRLSVVNVIRDWLGVCFKHGHTKLKLWCAIGWWQVSESQNISTDRYMTKNVHCAKFPTLQY
jgi:hypothetical protein